VGKTGPTGPSEFSVTSESLESDPPSIPPAPGLVGSVTISTTVENDKTILITGIQQTNPDDAKLLGYYAQDNGSTFDIIVDYEALTMNSFTFTAYYIYF
jgi:hypothetical protein